jgi:cysteinyl-tRNA synthetase
MHEWRDHDLLRRALEVFGLGSLAESDEAPAELQDLAARRAVARGGGDFDSADRIRAEIEEAGWEVRDVAGDPGYQLVPRR